MNTNEINALSVKAILELAKKHKITLTKLDRASKEKLVKAVAPTLEKVAAPAAAPAPAAQQPAAKPLTAKKKATPSTPAPGNGKNPPKPKGLVVHEVWDACFIENEKHWRAKEFSKILTDEQITAHMKKTFPGRSPAIFDYPQIVRTRFNACNENIPERKLKGVVGHRYVRVNGAVSQVPTRTERRDQKKN